MADWYLEGQRIKLENLQKYLNGSSINDFNHFSQLQAEFTTLSTLTKSIKDKINLYQNPRHRNIYRNFIKQCRITQLLLNKEFFEICSKNPLNSDFNYLYNHDNHDENLNGIEIYIYDIKLQTRTSTYELKSSEENIRLCDRVVNYIKFSNSYLLIIGTKDDEYKGFLIDLNTKIISEIFNISSKNQTKYCFNEFIYYDNYLFVFGELSDSGLMKYNINLNKKKKLEFPLIYGRLFSVLFHNYVLISQLCDSSFYLYDLLIESHSEITFYNGGKKYRFLFTDQVRAYLWIQNDSIYESDVNNPFKWNLIGNNDFGIHYSPSDVTFSSFEGNIYASFLMRPQMLCYKFNRERKEMELISTSMG